MSVSGLFSGGGGEEEEEEEEGKEGEGEGKDLHRSFSAKKMMGFPSTTLEVNKHQKMDSLETMHNTC